jgi:chromosome segregation ATPase
VERTAKARIATAEMRRQKALREQAIYTTEIQKLERQINGMKSIVARHESRADEAEDLAVSEEAELETLHSQRSKVQAKHATVPRAKRVDAYNDMEVEPW